MSGFQAVFWQTYFYECVENFENWWRKCGQMWNVVTMRISHTDRLFFHLSKKNSNKFNSIIKILFRQNINCSIPFHWNHIRIIGLSYFFHNSSQDKWKYGVVFFRANVREHMDLRHIRSQKFTKRHGNEVSQSKMRRCYATSRCFIHIFIGQVGMYAEWVCRKKGQYA